MATYQFGFSDSGVEGEFVDQREMSDADQARREAVRELSYMMTSRLPDGDHRRFSVTVKDAAGATLYAAELLFTAAISP